MQRQGVKSSNLKSVGYDPTTQELEVEFQNGGIYTYVGVPHEIHKELMTDKSVGSYYARNIRSQYALKPAPDAETEA
jgi:hypothetical protein